MTNLKLAVTVPDGPAGEYRERLANLLPGGHPASDAVARAVAELVAHLAPGTLGNAPARGEISASHPGLAGGRCEVTITVSVDLPGEETER